MSGASERRALLCMDYQTAVCSPDGAIGRRTGAAAHVASRDVLARASATIDRARSQGDLVVLIRVAFGDGRPRTNGSAAFEALEASGALAEGSHGSDFCDEIRPAPTDVIVTKTCVDPFVGTPLDGVLRRHGIHRLLLAGVATNFVVESAARHAGDAGYDVTVLEDLCASYGDEMHLFAIERTLPLFARIATSAVV